MKKMTLLLVVLGLSALSTYGQDAKGGQVLAESNVSKKATEEKKTPLKLPTPKSEILGKPVVYGGYFTDFVRAERKRALFDLRTPLDPKKDLENVSFYPGTDTVQAIVLFRIKF
jgi:hypothetical protein